MRPDTSRKQNSPKIRHNAAGSDNVDRNKRLWPNPNRDWVGQTGTGVYPTRKNVTRSNTALISKRLCFPTGSEETSDGIGEQIGNRDG